MFKLRKNRKGLPGGRRGQNITEYMILVVGVLTVVILAVRPGGFFTQGVNRALNLMFSGVDRIATETCSSTIDDRNGGWTNWSTLTDCVDCTRTQTRECSNPRPGCNGKLCEREDGTTTDGIETRSFDCASGSWVTGTCGACAGNCGDVAGTCARSVTCDGGCCDPDLEPLSAIACAKAPYPDVWTALGDWSPCSVICGIGTQTQTVTCSGTCCDAATKPPTRRACADGCCAQDLYIGRDIVNNVDFTGTFGPAANGASVTLTCPSGYGGTPTRTCTATADSAGCTGNDTYSPPASCYNIAWSDPVADPCLPANCGPSGQVDIGYGGYTLMYEFGGANHGGTAYVDCSTLTGGTSPVTWGHTGGNASYDCWLGKWENLNAACIPNCPAETVDIGAGVSYTFPETSDPTGAGVPVSYTCENSDKIGLPCGGLEKYEGTVIRTCTLGTWSAVSGACSYKSCAPEKFCDGTTGACVMFEDPNNLEANVPHGVTVTPTCEGTASATCEYGTWCNQDIKCATAPVCPAVDIKPEDGTPVYGTLPESNVGETGTLHCVAVTKDVTVICDASGQWIRQSGNCSINCPKEDNVDVGLGIKGCWRKSNSSPEYYYGLSEGCGPFLSCGGVGYTGAPRRICSGGLWGPVETPCVECDKTCPSQTVTITTGEQVTLPSGKCRQYSSSYSCPAGYDSYDRWWCSYDGTWERKMTCQKQPCTDPECDPIKDCGTLTKNDSCGNAKTLQCGDCCTGITPPGGWWDWCPGDSKGGTGNTKISIVTVDQGDCTTSRQCEVRCNTGYVADGTTCNWCTCPAPLASYYPDATVGPGDGTDNCGDQRTVTCKSGYTGTPNSTKITCGSITKTWTGDGPDCSPACVPQTCADRGMCSGSSSLTSYDDDCGGTISCGPCPQWVNVSQQSGSCSFVPSSFCQSPTVFVWYCELGICHYWRAASGSSVCDQVCNNLGLSSGTDSYGKICRSTETCDWSSCVDGKGGTVMWNMVGCRSEACAYALTDCYNSGQVTDSDSTDLVTACYCK